MIQVLALDVEGTLVSNAVSQLPRSGLKRFLETCHALVPRIVLFTSVRRDRVADVVGQLIADGVAPPWLATVEVFESKTGLKDLRVIGNAKPEEILLVDDMADGVLPDQRSSWVRVEPFIAPYAPDEALATVLSTIEARLSR